MAIERRGRTIRSVARHIPPALSIGGWVAFAWYLLAQARAGPPIVWTDSQSYSALATRPLWSKEFWVGSRPPLTALLIKAVGGSTGLVTAQAVVGALSWGALAFTVGRLVPPGWRRTVAVWSVLGFASTLPITLWNRSVLSESLSISVLALLVAAVIWSMRRITWPRIAAVTLLCLAFAALRDAQIWTVAMLGVAAAVVTLVGWRITRQLPWRLATGCLCLLAAAALTGWGAVASHRTNQNIADVFYVRVFPFPARVAWFTAHGMPEERRIDALSRASPPPADGVKVVAFSSVDPAFAPLRQWLHDQGSQAYLLWLVEHPEDLVSEPLQRPERAYNSAQGNLYFYAAPAASLMRSPLTSLLWPGAPELVDLAVVALLVGYLSGAWRNRAWRAVLVLAVIGVAAMLVAWNGDGQEVTRHTIEGFVEVRLGVWILLVVGLLHVGVPAAGTRALLPCQQGAAALP